MNVKTMVVQHTLGCIVDGVWGDRTTAAVKKFQADNGLTVDGVAGVKTMAAIIPMVGKCEMKFFDSTKFFQAIRLSLFGSLNQKQVDGLNAILAVIKHFPINEQAYMLATAYHETAYTMQPIYERGARSYFDKYETGHLAKVLGNTEVGDGYKYRGLGYVQLTGRTNYTRAKAKLGVDFVNHPELAGTPENAARIMMLGMGEGWFTGKKMSDYISSTDADYIGARRIINGTDQAAEIERYAMLFNIALRLAR